MSKTEPKVEIKKLADLIPDAANANAGTERGQYMLEASLRQVKAGRSVLLDKNLRLIAGNKTHEQAGQIGIEDIVLVHTNGEVLVGVVRDDLDLTDPDPNNAARQAAYYDNRSSEVGLNWEAEQILADVQAGFDFEALFRQDEIDMIIEQVDLSGVEFQEYDESAEDEVEYITCPHCGEKFPK